MVSFNLQIAQLSRVTARAEELVLIWSILSAQPCEDVWYLSEGPGICYLFALCLDIELVLAICQVSILQRALAGLEDCSGILLIPKN